MELQTAIEILEYHQEWRLGKREDMIHEPKKLTEALDIVLSEVKKLRLDAVSECYLLVKWIQGQPVIDGAKYADTKEEIMKYYDSLPKLPKNLVEYTICRIYNVR